jgi:hypothetical protein
MADKKISALTGASTPLTGSEVLPIVQSGSTVKVSIANVTAGRDASALIYRAGLSPADQGGAAAPAGGLFLKNNGTAGANTVVARLSDGTYPNSALPTVEFTGFGGGNGYSAAFWGTQFGGIVFATADTFGGTYTANLTLANGASGDATVNKGNLVIGTAGKGIDFSANTNLPGMTSELLNDYEEGDWTPTQGAGLTVVGSYSATGKYTKIGRQVTIIGEIVGSTSVAVSSGGVLCAGLPYTTIPGSPSVFASGLTNTNVNATSLVVGSGTTLYASTAIAATTRLYFSATYLTT